MKIGIISDIHSNILALEETYKKFQKENAEKIICIGDVVGIGPYPEKCLQFIEDKKDKFISIVKGNHENYVLKGIKRKNHTEQNAKPMNDEQIASHLWNHSRIREEQKKFIGEWKDRDNIEINNKKIIIEHYPMDKCNKYKKFNKNPSASEIMELFENKQADIYLFGHTHKKYFINKDGRYYINPGSLGCPIDTQCANAGILEIVNGDIRYEQININYDINRVIKDIENLNYPLNRYTINKFFRKEKN